MNSSELRTAVLKAAEASRMLVDLRPNQIREFESGTCDIKITQLNFESLAVIEFCLILEEEFGHSIPARRFYEFKSLQELIDDLETHESN
ncbi:MAG: hypothetical protein RIS09_390 [Actinomycetota bacterium]